MKTRRLLFIFLFFILFFSASYGNAIITSIRDSLKLHPSVIQHATSDTSIKALLLDSGCGLIAQKGRYIFYSANEGRFKALFTCRINGGLVADTITIIVTNKPPVLKVRNREATADLGKPIDFGLLVDDDGEGCVLSIDFNGDGKVDTVISNAVAPQLICRQPTYSGETERLFKPRLALKDNDGHVVYDTLSLRLRFRPPLARAGSNTIHCAGETVVLSGSMSRDSNTEGHIRKYRWDFNGDGKWDTVLSVPEVEHAYNRPGDYPVVLQVMDDHGNQSKPDTSYLSVIREKPFATITAPHDVKKDEPTLMQGAGKATCAEIESFAWDFNGDGKWDYKSKSHGRTRHTWTTAGSFDARFLVVDTKGDSAFLIWPVRVLP